MTFPAQRCPGSNSSKRDLEHPPLLHHACTSWSEQTRLTQTSVTGAASKRPGRGSLYGRTVGEPVSYADDADGVPACACLQPTSCGSLCETYSGNLAAALTTVPAGAVISLNLGAPPPTVRAHVTSTRVS